MRRQPLPYADRKCRRPDRGRSRHRQGPLELLDERGVASTALELRALGECEVEAPSTDGVVDGGVVDGLGAEAAADGRVSPGAGVVPVGATTVATGA